jgi:hypothetical protein
MIRRQFVVWSAIAAAVASVACTGLSQGQQSKQSPAPAPVAGAGKPLLGFSTFPFDITPDAVEKMYQLGRENGQIFVVQRDNGIPWKEALNNEALPSKVINEWSDFRKRRPANQPFYLAIAPLDFDRKNLAAACDGSSMPKSIQGAAFDSSAVKTAYLNYCRAAVKFFDPDYLNIGVEAGELAHRKPSAWPAFARLIEHVRSNLKQEFPDLQVGISFGLQSLMEPKAAELARPLVESCDYLGLSFYPYMSDFHEKFGTDALPAPPDEWIVPLEWVRSYTTKPIAICETGYNATDVQFSPASVSLRGSPAWQTQYVKDLARIAHRDNYLFVVWYFPVDLDRVLASLPDGGGAAKLWKQNGLFDKDLKPRPALAEWQKALQGQIDSSPATTVDSGIVPGGTVTPGGSTTVGSGDPAPIATLGFETADDMFAVPSGAKSAKAAEAGPDGRPAMEWSYGYSQKDWAWASKRIGEGKLARSSTMSFWVKSDATTPLIVQLKEKDGESHSFQITPGKKWSKVTMDMSSLTSDSNTRKDGVLDPARVVEIVLADGAGPAGKKGKRRVVFSRLDFR